MLMGGRQLEYSIAELKEKTAEKNPPLWAFLSLARIYMQGLKGAEKNLDDSAYWYGKAAVQLENSDPRKACTYYCFAYLLSGGEFIRKEDLHSLFPGLKEDFLTRLLNMNENQRIAFIENTQFVHDIQGAVENVVLVDVREQHGLFIQPKRDTQPDYCAGKINEFLHDAGSPLLCVVSQHRTGYTFSFAHPDGGVIAPRDESVVKAILFEGLGISPRVGSTESRDVFSIDLKKPEMESIYQQVSQNTQQHRL